MTLSSADEPGLNFFGCVSEAEASGGLPVFDGQTILVLETVMTCWSRMDGKHRLIVKRDGGVVAAGDTVDGFLANFGGIQLRKGKLYAGSKVSAAALNRALDVSGNQALAEILSWQNRQGSCILRSTSFDDSLVCLTLQPIEDDDYQPALPDMGVAFGLTPSEATVVISICTGHTPQQIAEEHNISIHTVRAHLRHCYGKLGVTCREELWHKLQPYLAS